MPKWHRTEEMTALAPDGAGIRNLIHHAQGATRLGLAEALVPPGARTAKVYHRTIYEEIWYFLRGDDPRRPRLLGREFRLDRPGLSLLRVAALARRRRGPTVAAAVSARAGRRNMTYSVRAGRRAVRHPAARPLRSPRCDRWHRRSR